MAKKSEFWGQIHDILLKQDVSKYRFCTWILTIHLNLGGLLLTLTLDRVCQSPELNSPYETRMQRIDIVVFIILDWVFFDEYNNH